MVVIFDTDQSDDGQKHGQGARLDPKLGAPRKTAGVRFQISSLYHLFLR